MRKCGAKYALYFFSWLVLFSPVNHIGLYNRANRKIQPCYSKQLTTWVESEVLSAPRTIFSCNSLTMRGWGGGEGRGEERSAYLFVVRGRSELCKPSVQYTPIPETQAVHTHTRNPGIPLCCKRTFRAKKPRLAGIRSCCCSLSRRLLSSGTGKRRNWRRP